VLLSATDKVSSSLKLDSLPIYRRRCDEGGLMSYGADFDDLFRKSAHYVDKILKGAKPADLAVQQPTKFEFVINLKAAKPMSGERLNTIWSSGRREPKRRKTT
jgi:putative tryptophan/tyrosine transport system substrate-binding protein